MYSYTNPWLFFCCSKAFDLRKPKRQYGVKVKRSPPILSSKIISDRPPAVLPKDAKTSVEDDCEVPATVDSHTHLALNSQSSVEYEYVKTKPNTFTKLKDVNAALMGKNIKVVS